MRREITCSPVAQWTQYRLAFDCGTRECWGERTIDLGAVAARRGGEVLVAHVMNQLRCASCGRAPRTVFLETGPRMSAQRGGYRRFMLRGLFPVGDGR